MHKLKEGTDGVPSSKLSPYKTINTESDKYKFNPLNHGYEPISKFPELEYMFPLLDDKYFIKIVAYSYYERLVYWYSVVDIFGHDERVQISSSSIDWGKPINYENQSKTLSTKYLGIISSDIFAMQLLQHIYSPPNNQSLVEGEIRYTENLGINMRQEYPEFYPIRAVKHLKG